MVSLDLGFGKKEKYLKGLKPIAPISKLM